MRLFVPSLGIDRADSHSRCGSPPHQSPPSWHRWPHGHIPPQSPGSPRCPKPGAWTKSSIDVPVNTLPAAFMAERGDRGRAVRLIRGMRDAADMPELQENASACRVNGRGHLLPPRHLGVGKNSRGVGISESAPRRHGGRLGYQQSSTGSLTIILRVQLRRHIASGRAAAGQRCEIDAVGRRYSA